MADNGGCDHAVFSRSGGILTVTFDRPVKHNAVSDDMLSVLDEAVTLLAAEDAARVLIIRAKGPYFTAGIDLGGNLLRSMREPSDFPGQAFRRVYRGLHRLFDDIETVEKPVILAAQGPCLGVGVELAASCDFRFASPNAVFALPEIRLGAIAGSGGTSRLTRLIGPHWTKWLAVAGETVSAEQALQIGFVHEVVAQGNLAERVWAFAQGLCALPGEALGVAKLATDLGTDTDRTTQRHIDRIAMTTLFGTPEFNRKLSKYES